MRNLSLLLSLMLSACALYGDDIPTAPDAGQPDAAEAPSCEDRRPLPICANVCSADWVCPSLNDDRICVCNEIYRYPPECVERYPL